MISAALLAVALSGLFEISDRTELRVRDPGSQANAASLDLETALSSRLVLASRRTRFTFTYVPRLSLWDATGSPSPSFMQAGGARAEWHDRVATWWVDEGASYGGLDLTAASFVPTGSAPPRVDVLPAGGLIQYGSSTTTLGTRAAWQRLSLEWTLGYQLSGGADEASRATMPLQAGPFAEARFDFRAGRRTHLVTRLAGEETEFSSGPEDAMATATEAWRYAWSRTTDTELALGAAEVRSELAATLPPVWDTHPVAEASIEQRFAIGPDRLRLRLDARIAPVINRVYGSVDERAQAILTGAWTHDRLAVAVFAAAQQTVPTDDPYAVQLVSGEATAAWAPSRSSVVAFDVGVRATAQRLSVASVPSSLVEGIAFVGVSLRAHPIRF